MYKENINPEKSTVTEKLFQFDEESDIKYIDESSKNTDYNLDSCNESYLENLSSVDRNNCFENLTIDNLFEAKPKYNKNIYSNKCILKGPQYEDKVNEVVNKVLTKMLIEPKHRVKLDNSRRLGNYCQSFDPPKWLNEEGIHEPQLINSEDNNTYECVTENDDSVKSTENQTEIEEDRIQKLVKYSRKSNWNEKTYHYQLTTKKNAEGVLEKDESKSIDEITSQNLVNKQTTHLGRNQIRTDLDNIKSDYSVSRSIEHNGVQQKSSIYSCSITSNIDKPEFPMDSYADENCFERIDNGTIHLTIGNTQQINGLPFEIPIEVVKTKLEEKPLENVVQLPLEISLKDCDVIHLEQPTIEDTPEITGLFVEIPIEVVKVKLEENPIENVQLPFETSVKHSDVIHLEQPTIEDAPENTGLSVEIPYEVVRVKLEENPIENVEKRKLEISVKDNKLKLIELPKILDILSNKEINEKHCKNCCYCCPIKLLQIFPNKSSSQISNEIHIINSEICQNQSKQYDNIASLTDEDKENENCDNKDRKQPDNNTNLDGLLGTNSENDSLVRMMKYLNPELEEHENAYSKLETKKDLNSTEKNVQLHMPRILSQSSSSNSPSLYTTTDDSETKIVDSNYLDCDKEFNEFNKTIDNSYSSAFSDKFGKDNGSNCNKDYTTEIERLVEERPKKYGSEEENSKENEIRNMNPDSDPKQQVIDDENSDGSLIEEMITEDIQETEKITEETTETISTDGDAQTRNKQTTETKINEQVYTKINQKIKKYKKKLERKFKNNKI